MSKKIVFFDFDGTLFHHKTEQIPSSTMKVLKTLADDPDTYLVLATGRTHYNLTPFEARYDYFDGYVLLNGLHTEFHGKMLDQQILNQSLAGPVIDTLEELGVAYGTFAASGQYISKLTKQIAADFQSVSFNVPPVGDIRSIEDIQQLFCFSPSAHFPVIAKRHPNFRIIPWEIMGCDIIPKGASKAVGVQKIFDYLGEPIKSYAFGDAMNDIEMFQRVDVGIAMGNAIDDLKAVATIIAPDIADDGVYHVAKQLGWIK
jgi:Cof subfamily protein (haloacid dehalogenase superfamily)